MQIWQLEIHDIHVIDGVRLVRLTRRAAAHNHHSLILRRREEHAGGLVAHRAATCSWHELGSERCLRKINDTRIDRKFVIHTPAVEKDLAIGELEKMRVEREARK